ncbi:MAG TPA: tol-pal system protein YbgF [Burkholderiales bacterium]|jgi:tol-pal system protein YbgF|nr:tol-pal system protein YbgF [Burkholderiales bacterium]
MKRAVQFLAGSLAVFGVLAMSTMALPAHAALFGNDDQIKQIDQRLTRLEDQFKNQGLLDLYNQIQTLKQQVTDLRGQIEVLNNKIRVTQKQQKDMYVDLDTRLRRLEQAGGAGGAVPPTNGAAPAPGTASAGAANPSSTADAAAEQRAYDAAQKLRGRGDYKGAIAAFEKFLKDYPGSTLAPRAQYWIGDSQFNLHDYAGAIKSQRTLLSAYPDSSSASDALLNLASSQKELGDSVGARATMQDLIKRFPDSTAAGKAKERLANLK